MTGERLAIDLDLLVRDVAGEGSWEIHSAFPFEEISLHIVCRHHFVLVIGNHSKVSSESDQQPRPFIVSGYVPAGCCSLSHSGSENKIWIRIRAN